MAAKNFPGCYAPRPSSFFHSGPPQTPRLDPPDLHNGPLSVLTKQVERSNTEHLTHKTPFVTFRKKSLLYDFMHEMIEQRLGGLKMNSDHRY